MNDRKKVAFITGANAGVGLELTKKLVAEGWDIVALIRSDFHNDYPIINNGIRKNQIRVYKANLADLQSLKHALQNIKEAEPYLDVIFNNAGISLADYAYSKSGRELHFEINTLVPFIIFTELNELLQYGKMRTVVNTSSNSLLFVRQYTFEKMIFPDKTPFKKVTGPYASSKLALSIWTKYIAGDQQRNGGVHMLSACPGPSKTKLTTGDALPAYLLPIRKFVFAHPARGAERLYNAAIHGTDITNGAFLNRLC